MKAKDNDNDYWDRWHELLDTRAERSLTPNEQREYDAYEFVVKKRDNEEAEKCRPCLDKLAAKHSEVISSIERLTEAVKKAAGVGQ